MRRFILIILLVLTPALLVADYHTYKLQLEEAVAKKEQYIKDFEAAGILRLRAIMVAKCKDYYEISFQGNDRALLFTEILAREILACLSLPKTLMSQGRGQRIFSARSRLPGPFQPFCHAPKNEVFTRQWLKNHTRQPISTPTGSFFKNA